MRALIPEMDPNFSKVPKFLVGKVNRGNISQVCGDKYCNTLFTATCDIDWMHKNGNIDCPVRLLITWPLSSSRHFRLSGQEHSLSNSTHVY